MGKKSVAFLTFIIILVPFSLVAFLFFPQEVRAAPVELYEHTGYQGTKVWFAGDYPDFNQLIYDGKTFNDQASSIKVPPGVKVTLYEHTGYDTRGASKVFTGDDPNFNAIAGPSAQGTWNDVASSIKIETISSAPSTAPANFQVWDENDQALDCSDTDTYIVHFKWKEASGASGYKAQVNDSGVMDFGNTLGFGYPLRKVGVTYRATVWGYNSSGDGPKASLSFNVPRCSGPQPSPQSPGPQPSQPPSPPPGGPEPPTTPTGLQATKRGNEGVELCWNDKSDKETHWFIPHLRPLPEGGYEWHMEHSSVFNNLDVFYHQIDGDNGTGWRCPGYVEHGLTPGVHKFWIGGWNDNAKLWSSWSNEVSFTIDAPSLPDLIITDPTLKDPYTGTPKTEFAPGEQAQVNFIVKNQGNVPASNFTVGLYRDFPNSQPDCTKEKDGTDNPDPLNPNYWAERYIVFQVPPDPGPKSLKLLVDADGSPPNCQVVESNESNNVAELGYTVAPPGPPNMPTAALKSLQPHKLDPEELSMLLGEIPLPSGQYLPEQYKISPRNPGAAGLVASCTEWAGACWEANGIKGSTDGLPDGLAIAWVSCYGADAWPPGVKGCGTEVIVGKTVATERATFPCETHLNIPGFNADAICRDTGSFVGQWVDVYKETGSWCLYNWPTGWYLIGYQ